MSDRPNYLTEHRYSPKSLGIDPTPGSHPYGSPERIYTEAFKAADTKVVYTFTEHGGDPSFCGIVWITIKPARGEFVAWCKRKSIGYAGTYGGWTIGLPCSYDGQALAIKEAAAKAFVEVLREHEITAQIGTRID